VKKIQEEVYDLKWINNGTVVFDRVADEVFQILIHTSV